MQSGAALVGGLEDLFLHEGLGEAHVRRSLHLPLDEHRVERAAAVVRDPDLVDRHEPRLCIDFDFGDVRGEGVGRRRPDRGPAVAPVHVLRGVVRSGGAQSAVLRLGQVEGLAQGHRRAGVAGLQRETTSQQHLTRLRAPLLGHRLLHHRLDPPRGVDARVAEHEGDARRVGPEVDRGEVGVARKHADVLERDAQLLGHDVGHHRVDPLPDLRGARKHRDAPGAVDLELDARLRHLVGVDRVVCARDVGRAGHADPAPVGEAAELPLPVAGALHRVEALQEAVGCDAQVVDGAGVRADEVAPAQIDRVDCERFRDAVELHLEGEARLDRPVPPLGSARGLVGVGPGGVEAIGGHLVWGGQELARVVRRHQSEGRVRAAIQDDLGVDRGEHALPRGAGAVSHVEGVATAVRVEDLFTGVEDLDGPAGHHGQLGHAEFEVEGLGLAAERAAHRWLHDPHERRVHLQHAGELAVQVVGDLRRRPHGQLPARLRQPDRAMGLDGCVGCPLEEVVALHHHIGIRQATVDIAERELDHLGDVSVAARLAGLVDVRATRGRDRFVRIEVDRQLLVGDVDEIEGGDGGFLVDRRHRGHAVAHIADLVHAEWILVGRPGDDAVGGGHVPAGHHGVHTRKRLGAGGVDRDDPGVGMGAAQDLAVQHAGKLDVVGVARASAGLGEPVHLAHAAADGRELGSGIGLAARPVGRCSTDARRGLAHNGGRRAGPGAAPAHQPPSLAAAASTAS